MAEFIDLTGHRYGLWTVIKKMDRERYWLCRCDCGTVKEVYSRNMRRGVSTNCGCRKARISHDLFQRHGEARGGKNGLATPLYRTWQNMRSRCSNPNRPDFPRYGGRGITVCEEWLSFEPFRDWANQAGYRAGVTLDRIDNDRGYSPDNCRWASRAVQALNREPVHTLADGRPAISVARQNGINSSAFHNRLKMGWSLEKAATKPVRLLRRKSSLPLA